jgi:hypothetical protein
VVLLVKGGGDAVRAHGDAVHLALVNDNLV